MLRHRDEGGMVGHHGCQHLFGDICSAEKAEPEGGPARDPQLHHLQNGCVEGCGGVGGLLGQRNAQVLHARPLYCEAKLTPVVASGPAWWLKLQTARAVLLA